jgi:hypothetical protein
MVKLALILLTLTFTFSLAVTDEASEVVPPECADGMSRWRGPEWEARWCGRASPPPRVRVLESTPGAKYCAMHPSANGGELLAFCTFPDLKACRKSVSSRRFYAECQPKKE